MADAVTGISYRNLGIENKKQLGGKDLTAEQTNEADFDYTDGLSEAELKKMDADNDGTITEAEFKAAMKDSNLNDTIVNSLWTNYLSAFQKASSVNSTDNPDAHKLNTDNFANIMQIFSGGAVSESTYGNLVLFMQRELHKEEGVVTDFAAFTDAFLEKYEIDAGQRQPIINMLQGLSENGSFSANDIGRAAIAYTFLEDSGANALTKDKMLSVMKLLAENTEDFSKLSDSLHNLGVTLSEGEIRSVLKKASASEGDKAASIRGHESTGFNVLRDYNKSHAGQNRTVKTNSGSEIIDSDGRVSKTKTDSSSKTKSSSSAASSSKKVLSERIIKSNISIVEKAGTMKSLNIRYNEAEKQFTNAGLGADDEAMIRLKDAYREAQKRIKG